MKRHRKKGRWMRGRSGAGSRARFLSRGTPKELAPDPDFGVPSRPKAGRPAGPAVLASTVQVRPALRAGRCRPSLFLGPAAQTRRSIPISASRPNRRPAVPQVRPYGLDRPGTSGATSRTISARTVPWAGRAKKRSIPMSVSLPIRRPAVPQVRPYWLRPSRYVRRYEPDAVGQACSLGRPRTRNLRGETGRAAPRSPAETSARARPV